VPDVGSILTANLPKNKAENTENNWAIKQAISLYLQVLKEYDSHAFRD
jgi:hypothetical protein